MIIRAVQWNIGGGNIRQPKADPKLANSYTQEGLSYCIEQLRKYSPDIVTLQESHADKDRIQAQIVSKELGLPYFVNDEYDQSHIDPSQRLCQSVISRFPISEHSFKFFFNPKYQKVMENSQKWASHDKGITTCKLENGLTIQTLHLIPFRVFEVDFTDERARKVTSSIEEMIEKDSSPYLLQGDFNHSELESLLPNIYQNGLEEIGGQAATTPKGRVYDHVLARGMKSEDYFVDSKVLTDHFSVISTFEL